MDPFLTLFGVVLVAFVSTNLDNLLLLIGWQLAGHLSTWRLFAGYLLGMLGVLGLAILIGLVGYLLPVAYLGYLGIIPLALGVRLLVKNLRPMAERDVAGELTGTVAAIAATQLSNGVDTVVIFAPLLADSQLVFDMQIAVLFLLFVLIWFLLARVLGVHLGRLKILDRAGRWLTPLVMIGVGFYILANTATDIS